MIDADGDIDTMSILITVTSQNTGPGVDGYALPFLLLVSALAFTGMAMRLARSTRKERA
ncbi:MAG: hypothetical protein Q6373_009100 [Candidatus Sigynarchaeota archaeon]